ncbi:MAG: hypothetical protein WCH57_06940 [Verrucomicrobiota bacterium]
MPDKNEPEKIWDEYDWERFLQQQDRKTERYMELLEKYIDDPERDQIIAQEMGWPNPVESHDFDWNDLPFESGGEEEEDCFEASADAGEEEEESGAPESFELHPLYQASFALTIWIDQIFDELGDLQNAPAAVKLATNSAVASAKLAAALSDDDAEELGMTIAYLKRALKAITNAIDASLLFAKEAPLSSRRRRQLHARLFQVRDGIIELMGDYRCEWRRRYGA